jgi:hypothetical protein
VQVHTSIDIETARRLVNELVDKLNELEDESQPTYTVTVAMHPLIR